MKLMMQKWCWIGLILCASGTAWAAKAGDDDDKTETKAKKSSKADSDEDAKDDTKGDSTKDDATKDDSAGDEEEETSKPAAKKEANAKAEVSATSNGSNLAFNIGAQVGYGTSPFTRLGYGLRGGVTLGDKEGLYLGVSGMLFTGTSVTQERLTGTAERTRKTIVIGADVGYDVVASDDILLRPYMSVGVALNSDHSCATGTCWDDNGGHLTLAPGAQGMYMLGSGFWAGADMHYQIIMSSSDATALVLSLALGIRF